MLIENNIEYEKLAQTQKKLESVLLDEKMIELNSILYDLVDEAIIEIAAAREVYDKKRIKNFHK